MSMRRRDTMSRKDDGGAFPVLDTKYGFEGTPMGLESTDSGMTLRDWFAGQALGGAVFGVNVYEREAVARHCFAIADAMIAERNKEDSND
jgi:hypothetical protein